MAVFTLKCTYNWTDECKQNFINDDLWWRRFEWFSTKLTVSVIPAYLMGWGGISLHGKTELTILNAGILMRNCRRIHRGRHQASSDPICTASGAWIHPDARQFPCTHSWIDPNCPRRVSRILRYYHGQLTVWI